MSFSMLSLLSFFFFLTPISRVSEAPEILSQRVSSARAVISKSVDVNALFLNN